MRVAIIGAGLAGLTAARLLRQAGLSPVVCDKGRSPGGRLSTRRAGGGLQFDHGAQYLSPKSADFAALLRDAEKACAAGTWTLDDGSRKIVGTPGMSAIAGHLRAGADVRQGVEIPEIVPDTRGWSVAGERYDRVICAIPAPQAARLLHKQPQIVEALDTVRMEPNLTLMMACQVQARHAFTTRLQRGEDLAWLALDSAKHARPGPDCWVAQAGPEWSGAHLERDKDEIAARMLPMVCDALGLERGAVIHAAAHKWRYAHASKPLGQPYLTACDTLFVGGDWALCARAEGAWQSGRAMAGALLETL